MKRAVFITTVGLAMIGLFGAGQAQADTYCAELPADVSCDQNFMGTTTAIQEAVTAADENDGPDNVKVGPGVFVMASPVYLDSFGPDNQLTLTGSGPSTVLKGADPTDPEIHFHAPQGSSINSLTISITDEAATSGKRGLVLTGDSPVANDLDVNFVTGTTGDKTTGVVLQDGATLKDSRVSLYNSNVNTAVASTGGGTQTVQGSTLTAFRNVDQRNTTGTLEVRKSALIAVGVGGLNQGGTLNIRDSVIVNPFGNGDGVFASSEGAFSETLVEGTTILGTPATGPTPTVGVVAQAAYGDPTPANTRFRLNNSVIYGYDYAIAYAEFYPEDTLNIGVDSSAYDSTRVSAGAGLGTPTLDIRGLVDLKNGVDPKFKDLPNGDYSLAVGSPLIDRGQAAAPPAGSKDFSGNPRACDGNDDGTIRRDIGAFELKTNPADDCTYPETTMTGPGFVDLPSGGPAPDVVLHPSSSEPNSTFICRHGGAPEITCSDPWTVEPNEDGQAVGGYYYARAVDEYGNIDQTETSELVTVIFGKPDPGCEGLGNCPPTGDTTPPKVLKLKAPRKTNLKRVKVRFKSNEAKVIFTCKLNKKAAKRCKSPWKTPKLKKGKNVIQIRATDKAGNRSKIYKRTIKRVVRRR